MSRRRTVGILGLALVTVGAGTSAAWSAGLLPVGVIAAGNEPAASPSASARSGQTAEIERRTLQVTSDLDGTLGYEGDTTIDALLPGTLTWLPSEGTVITRGKRLYEVDGKTDAVLMIGVRPAWRTLGPGVSDGADVRQLEQNLRKLGYGRKLEVDSHWTDRTTAAVKRWQRHVGLEADGVIDLGEVVFEPTTFRVTEQAAALGSRVGGGAPVLKGTTTKQVVTVSLEADHQDLIRKGDAVTVELPDGSTAPGHVSDVGRVAHAGERGNIPGETSPATIDVTVTLDDPSAAGSLDQAPVTVKVVTSAHENVLAVPVSALVALLEGGYAVELVEGNGSHRYVPVELGMFADGWVEVTGDGLQAGQKVVVAS